MISIQQQLDSFKETGFVVVDRYLSRDTIKVLKNIMISEVEQEHAPYQNFDSCHIHDLFVRHPEFHTLLDDQFLDDILAALLGKHWIMYAGTSSSVPPYSSNYASRMHVDSPRFVENYLFNVGVIWTLDNYEEDNGCLQVVKRSHLSAELPTAYQSDLVLCSEGSLIIFNARLYHRTTANQTNRWRHAMTMNACRPFMKQRMDWVRFLGEDAIKTYSRRLQRILGFHTRVPASMEEFALPIDQRMYKPGQE